MKPAAAVVLTAALVAFGCAGASGARPASTTASSGPPCAGITPPRRLTTAPVALPSSLTAAGVRGIVVVEAVIGPEGAVSDVRPARTGLDLLAPFGQKSVQDSRFAAGSVDGHPTSVRVRVATTLGTAGKAGVEPEWDGVWAYVPGGQSREAVWQLAGSVAKLTLEIHLGTSPATGAEVVARAPDGKERLLERIPGSPTPIELKETVSTEKFLEQAGDYTIELRASGKTLVSTTVTIAADYTRAIVNACAPL